jgi:hypothetical protein
MLRGLIWHIAAFLRFAAPLLTYNEGKKSLQTPDRRVDRCSFVYCRLGVGKEGKGVEIR